MNTCGKWLVYVALPLFVAIAAAVQSAYAQEGQAGWSGNVNVFGGKKDLKADDWKPADKPTEFGIEVDFKRTSWPVSAAIEYLYATGEGTTDIPPGVSAKAESKISEFNIGPRYIYDGFPRLRPFIGLGVSFVNAEAKASVPVLGVSASTSASGTGYWIGGGVYWTLAQSLNIGLVVKGSFVKAKPAGATRDAEVGGTHYGLLLGWHWGT